jgi:hypothetical protein
MQWHLSTVADNNSPKSPKTRLRWPVRTKEAKKEEDNLQEVSFLVFGGGNLGFFGSWSGVWLVVESLYRLWGEGRYHLADGALIRQHSAFRADDSYSTQM